MQISKEEYAKFQEHYAWQLLQSPDYRLGQAFLNFFPDVSSNMRRDGDLGALDELRLYNETDKDIAQQTINRWIDGA